MRVRAMRTLQKLSRLGFTHIFTTNVINKILALITNMVIVRIMSKSDYGIFSYAFNVIGMIMIFSSLGTPLAKFQFCCETANIEKRNKITRFLTIIGFFSNLFFAGMTFLYAVFLPLSVPQSRGSLCALAFLCIVQFFYDMMNYDLRVSLRNKSFAAMTNINTLSYFIFSCIGAWGWGLYGTIIGRYIGYIIPVGVGFFLLKDSIKAVLYSDKIKLKEGFIYIKYGLTIVLANSVSSILYSLDVYLVGSMSSSLISIADYKTATLIPNALAFIPVSMLTFVYPYFASHKDDAVWVKRNYKKMQVAMVGINTLIVIGGIAFAPFIIKLLFGVDYLTSVKTFRILMVAYFFSGSFRVLSGQVLVMLRKVNANLIMGIIECVFNIIADVILIKHYGSTGAAVATTLVVVFSSVLSGGFLNFILRKGTN